MYDWRIANMAHIFKKREHVNQTLNQMLMTATWVTRSSGQIQGQEPQPRIRSQDRISSGFHG